MSKGDAAKLIEYVELGSKMKENPQLKNKIDEMLKINSITKRTLSESTVKGIKVIDTVAKVGNVKVGDVATGNGGVVIDPKTKAIVAKPGSSTLSKSTKPKKLKTLDGTDGKAKPVAKSITKLPVMDKTKIVAVEKPAGTPAPKTSTQNLKLDVKAENKLKESADIASAIKLRSNSLNEKLSKIIEISEKERGLNEEAVKNYPFVQLLSESDRKRFIGLSATDKQKVADRVKAVPTVENCWSCIPLLLGILTGPMLYLSPFNLSIKSRCDNIGLGLVHVSYDFVDDLPLISCLKFIHHRSTI
jgi:hypothetical protein